MKVDKRTIRTKNDIKKAFAELLTKETFEKISVSEIAEKANINRVSFYTHYQDKYELINEMINDATSELINEAVDKAKSYKNESEILNYCMGLSCSFINICNKYRDIIITLQSDENAMLLFLIQDTATDFLIKILKKVDYFVPLKYDITFVAKFLVNGYSKVMLDWMIDPKGITTENLIEQLNSLSKDIINSKILFK